MEDKKPSYKYCMVPKCKNTIVSTPDKLFFRIPCDAKVRKKWCKMMRRDNVSPLSVVFCCEDHFDIETDMENYIKYKLVGGRIKLKKGTIPHKFKCQQENENTPEISAVQKHNKIKYFEKLLSKEKEPITSTLDALEKTEEVFVASCEYITVIKEEEDPLSFENNDQCLEI